MKNILLFVASVSLLTGCVNVDKLSRSAAIDYSEMSCSELEKAHTQAKRDMNNIFGMFTLDRGIGAASQTQVLIYKKKKDC